MREFFHGWRRKAGVATLVMAMMVVVAWLDSVNRREVLFQYGDGLYVFESRDGTFGLGTTTMWFGPKKPK